MGRAGSRRLSGVRLPSRSGGVVRVQGGFFDRLRVRFFGFHDLRREIADEGFEHFERLRFVHSIGRKSLEDGSADDDVGPAVIHAVQQDVQIGPRDPHEMAGCGDAMTDEPIEKERGQLPAFPSGADRPGNAQHGDIQVMPAF